MRLTRRRTYPHEDLQRNPTRNGKSIADRPEGARRIRIGLPGRVRNRLHATLRLATLYRAAEPYSRTRLAPCAQPWSERTTPARSITPGGRLPPRAVS